MNKIDVYLNAIAQKYLAVEVFGPVCPNRPAKFSNFRIHAALLAAFEGGVRHAGNIGRATPRALIGEVDIDVERLEDVSWAGLSDERKTRQKMNKPIAASECHSQWTLI